jgi:hypothetical protein
MQYALSRNCVFLCKTCLSGIEQFSLVCGPNDWPFLNFVPVQWHFAAKNPSLVTLTWSDIRVQNL